MILAQLAIILGALFAVLCVCLVAARLGVLTVSLRRPPKPAAPKEPTNG